MIKSENKDLSIHSFCKIYYVSLFNFDIMKALSIIFYTIGAGLLVASCFTTGMAVTWWLGGAAIVLLIIGCILQFSVKKHEMDTLINDERHAHFNS